MMEHVAGVVIVGTTMDWAVIGKVKMTLGPYGDEDEVRYGDLPYWRLTGIIIASALIGGSLTEQSPLSALFWIGTLMFVSLNIYGVRLALKGRPNVHVPKR